jgi:fibro-slime domain-containing protein
MPQHRVYRGRLSLLALMLCGLGIPAHGAPEGPEIMYINGVVRDFRRSHPDFNVRPEAGAGHYALNIKLMLGEDGRPAFRGGGFIVRDQWRDIEERPIPPHLYAGGAGLVKLVSAPTVGPYATADTWDSSVGPYGGGNVGPSPIFYDGAEMPVITLPEGMPANVGVVSYDGVGSTVLSHDLHCDVLSVRDLHILRISHDITIVCEEQFTMRDGGRIELEPEATLTLYTKGTVELVDATVNANTDDTSRFAFYHLGDTPVRLADGAEIYAALVAPNSGLYIEDDADFYGTYTGATLNVVNTSGFHLDARMPIGPCGDPFADLMGEPGMTSSGGISSAETYSQWYRDVMGTNLSMPHTIALLRNADGVYEFFSDTFYPLDGGLLFGNEGDAHNFYFTFNFTADFTYQACTGQFIEFMGADDAWLFVDRDLGIDLGGIIPFTQQHLDLDRLNLEDGMTYSMRFFYAQRNPALSVFRLRTNVPLIMPDASAVSAGFD